MNKSEFKKQFSMVRFQLRNAARKGYGEYSKVVDLLCLEYKTAYSCSTHIPTAVSISCALLLSKKYNRPLSYFDVK